jgi:cytochrome c oxidase subunit 2
VNGFLRRFLFLPPQASTVAAEIDGLHYFVILLTMAGATLVTLVGFYYLVRYRRQLPEPARPNVDAAVRPRSFYKITALGVLALLFLTWWVIGARQYMRLRIAPAGARDVYVTAKQWMWKFAYPEGARSISTLYVPAGRPVRLIMTSRDVIHSFFVPDFRIKQDVLPGRYTTVWFEAKAPGTYEIFCTQYCGTGHSIMRGEVVALTPEDFERWLGGHPPGGEPLARPLSEDPSSGPRRDLDLVRVGERVAAREGCLRCHTADGTLHIGPTWAGLYDALVPLQGGGEVVADVAYLTESIMDPQARIHRGYLAVMPSYLGKLGAPETAAIVEYIKSLREVPAQPGARTPLSAQPPGAPLEEGAQGRGERRLPPPPELPGGDIETLDGGSAP